MLFSSLFFAVFLAPFTESGWQGSQEKLTEEKKNPDSFAPYQVWEKQGKGNKKYSIPKKNDGNGRHEVCENQQKISFTHSGKGELAFLKSIDGIKNKGVQGDNWIFRVNNKLGKKSFGITELKPGDRVSWTFGKYKP